MSLHLQSIDSNIYGWYEHGKHFLHFLASPSMLDLSGQVPLSGKARWAEKQQQQKIYKIICNSVFFCKGQDTSATVCCVHQLQSSSIYPKGIDALNKVVKMDYINLNVFHVNIYVV